MVSTVAQRAASFPGGAGAGRRRRRLRRQCRGGSGRWLRAPRRPGVVGLALLAPRAGPGPKSRLKRKRRLRYTADVPGGGGVTGVAVGLEVDEGAGGVAEAPEELHGCLGYHSARGGCRARGRPWRGGRVASVERRGRVACRGRPRRLLGRRCLWARRQRRRWRGQWCWCWLRVGYRCFGVSPLRFECA